MVVWTRRAVWALFLLGTPAFAQPADPDAASIEAPVEKPAPKPAPAPSPIVPPRAELTEGPLYPDGAHGDATVVIELTVRRDGGVEKLAVVSGDEPFAAAALAAAAKFRFAPATRDGEPVPARIRWEIRFQEPEPVPAEPDVVAPPSTPGTEPQARPAEPPPPTEVIVHGVRPEAPKTTLSRAEVREIPGTFGDPFRAVEVLPGVTPIFSGVPYFYVRGAPPGNVGYFLDGVRVPLLYHFALGPSVIHPGLVDRVDLYAGGYPARYGRFAGGIVAAETRAPSDRWRGEANIRLFDAGALLEAPFWDGKATALAAGRYSYTGGVLSLVAPEVTLAYWDYQLRTSVKLGDRDTVSLFGFGAYDLFTIEEESDEPGGQPEENGISTQFHRADLRWDHEFGARTRARTAATIGWERSGSEATSDVEIGSEDFHYAGRFELEHRLNDDALFRAGADVTVDDVVASFTQNTLDDDGDEQELSRTLPTRTDIATGLRGDFILGLGHGITVTPGIRFDVYHSQDKTVLGVDPRIAARFDVSRTVSLEHAFGIVHQPPSFVIPLPGFELADLRGGLQKGVQHAAGVEWRLPHEWVTKATLFQASYFDLSDLLSLVQYGDELDDIGPSTRTIGHAYGLEFILRRPLTKKFGGYLAYTLSRSERSVGRVHHVASFDRSHVLHVAAAYDLGWRWRAGSRVTFYTGNPSTVQAGDRYVSAAPAPDPGPGMDPTPAPMAPPVIEEPPPRHRRAPPFFRLDVRFEKRWPRGTDGAWISFVLEVLNATLTKETVSYECDDVDCRAEKIGPVTIPSIGLEGAF